MAVLTEGEKKLPYITSELGLIQLMPVVSSHLLITHLLICEKPSSIFWKTSSEALKSCYWIPPKLSLLQAKQAQSGLSASPHVLQFPVILVPVC